MTRIRTPGVGPVMGVTRNGVDQWLGIPYAIARRFGAPEPTARWRSPMDCSAFGPRALQVPGLRPGRAAAQSGRDEKCLTLNIYAPEGQQAEALPVMVWLHGGGFLFGSAEPFDGAHFARAHGIIVVTVNYRLGVFGFVNFKDILSHPQIVSNPGLRDQIAALAWVQRHIAAFGGDPDQVTLAGESAGAMAAAMHMLNPGCAGLFQRVILQSGALSFTQSRPYSMQLARRYLAHLPGADEGAAAQAEALLTAPPEALLEAQCHVAAELEHGSPAAPWWDSDLLPGSLDEAQVAPRLQVPLLAGSTREEIRFFELPGLTRAVPRSRAQCGALLTKRFGPERADEILTSYDEGRAGRRALASDLVFRMPVLNFATRHSAEAPVWMYSFDARHPVLGACHALELPYLWDFKGVYGALCRGGLPFGRHARMAQDIQYRWASFVKGGPPGEDWPQYEADSREVLSVSGTPQVVTDPDADRHRVWLGQECFVQG